LLKSVAVVVLASSVLLLGGAPANADCSRGPAWPPPREARGTTFVGVVTGLARDDETNAYAWRVEEVHAGDVVPGRLARWGYGPQGCHPIVVRPGTRYLVSSGHPSGAGGAATTVAYELLGAGRVRLSSFGTEQPASSAPRVYRVDTLAEALALLVPELPATDASPPGRSAGTGWLPIAGVAAALGVLAWVRRRRHGVGLVPGDGASRGEG
jgi:hypothetical protein